MVGPVTGWVLLAVALAAISGPGAQSSPLPGPPYDTLNASQRRVLQRWADGAEASRDAEAGARDQYNAAPMPFRVAFEEVTAQLSALVLSDPENGEVLGTALDLVDAVEPPSAQAAADPTPGGHTLAVRLAPGARDRLRRSAEFERLADITSASATIFQHAGPPALRLAIVNAGARAIVTVLTP